MKNFKSRDWQKRSGHQAMRPYFQGLTILDQFVIVYLSKNRQSANKKKLLVNFIIINIDQDNAHVVVMVVATQELI